KCDRDALSSRAAERCLASRMRSRRGAPAAVLAPVARPGWFADEYLQAAERPACSPAVLARSPYSVMLAGRYAATAIFFAAHPGLAPGANTAVAAPQLGVRHR